jgi:hypothetical protein
MTRTALFSSARILRAADDSNAAGAPKAPEPKTVADDMDARRIFPNIEEATTYLTKMAEELSDFDTTAIAAAGMDSEGNFDPKVYTSDMDVMVSVLGSRKGGVKAIVVAPVPKIQTILDNPEAVAWMTKILHKELNHVAVRALREAADVATVVDQIPTTLGGYISSQRESAGIIETYNELYKGLNATMSAKIPVWAKARLTKGELKRALESKAYAEEYYPALENRGEGKDSLFVMALQLGIAGAKGKGLDPAIFQRWTDTRNQKALTAGDEEGDDFDLSSLTESMLKADEPKADAPAQ